MWHHPSVHAAPPGRRWGRRSLHRRSAVPLLPPGPDIGQANETIDGQVVTASRLLKEYLFSLPMIQRPYDWPEDEALGLLDELLESVGPSTGRQVR